MTQRRRLRIVITAGPTREHLDSVRYISNASSGKMGYAIAAAAARAGHDVTLVSGPAALPAPKGVRVVRVVSADEMAAAALRAFRGADAAVFAAAVADYQPRRRLARKLPKRSASFSLALSPTVDVAATLGRVKGRRVTIGFALEDHDGRAKAEAKLARKRFDAIVLNGPENIGETRAVVQWLARGGRWERWPAGSKAAVARRIVRQLERFLD